MTNKEIINNVYEMLKSRTLHPSGKFDNSGKFFAEHADLINVRNPTRAWPYSHMVACRTRKYVTAVCDKFNCRSASELRDHV